MSEEMNQDPITNPVPGDVVRGIWAKPSMHMGVACEAIKCQAVVGNLIAFTAGSSGKVQWCLKPEWCCSDVWIKGYEILQRGERP